MKDLQTWVVEYQTYKDVFQKKLKDTKIKDDTVVLQYKDKDVIVVCREDLNGFDNFDEDMLVALNTKGNVDWALSNWGSLVEGDITLHFVNLDTKNNWVVKPSLHNKVTPKKQLKKSLKTLFETVKEV